MPALQLPPDVAAVLRECFTCEIATVNRRGQPITWPSLPYYDEVAGQIIVTVSIAFPVKAQNARRNPRVSLLYSDPTGSALEHAPAVLVQGDATVAELLDLYSPQTMGLFKVAARRQPDSRRFYSNRVARRLFAWYLFQRIAITITPRRILVWPDHDFSAAPTTIEVSHVE